MTLKCPFCETEVVHKHSEMYKAWYICPNKKCWVVSLILTTTKKEMIRGHKNEIM